MKRIVYLMSLILIACLVVFALASCESTAVTVGDNGNWFIGEEDTGVKASGTNATIGSNGNWYLDGTDTGKVAVGKDGTPAERITVGENGNWFIGQTDTGVFAVSGKYAVNVTSDTELDDKTGKCYTVTVITYSDGTEETLRREIPDRVQNIMLMDGRSSIEGQAPYLTLNVITESGSSYYVPVTDDMLFSGKPDFSKAGLYDTIIAYGGKLCYETFTVVDSEGITPIEITLYPNRLPVGSDLSEQSLNVHFSNGYSYRVRLSDATVSATPDLTTAGDKSFSVTYMGYTRELTLTVFDTADGIIDSLYIYGAGGDIIIPRDATEQEVKELLKTVLVGQRLDAILIEEIYGTNLMILSITEDMLDTSALDTSTLGRYMIGISVSIPGIGKASLSVGASIKADVSSASLLKVYTNSSVTGNYIGDISAYDNGVAVITDGILGEIYATYEQDPADNTKITAYTSGMTLYFIVNNSASEYTVYVPDSEPVSTYVSVKDNAMVRVYSDVVIYGVYTPAEGSSPERFTPVFSMPKSAITENGTIRMIDIIVTLNGDGTLGVERL
ncbi:MAG: hypothetical protein IJY01_01300 [Clostridia bacterium]|nr:hypothetical protein [Clostridia bacterium]